MSRVGHMTNGNFRVSVVTVVGVVLVVVSAHSSHSDSSSSSCCVVVASPSESEVEGEEVQQFEQRQDDHERLHHFL